MSKTGLLLWGARVPSSNLGAPTSIFEQVGLALYPVLYPFSNLSSLIREFVYELRRYVDQGDRHDLGTHSRLPRIPQLAPRGREHVSSALNLGFGLPGNSAHPPCSTA
jgi:hypothetical protein